MILIYLHLGLAAVGLDLAVVGLDVKIPLDHIVHNSGQLAVRRDVSGLQMVFKAFRPVGRVVPAVTLKQAGEESKVAEFAFNDFRLAVARQRVGHRDPEARQDRRG